MVTSLSRVNENYSTNEPAPSELEPNIRPESQLEYSALFPMKNLFQNSKKHFKDLLED